MVIPLGIIFLSLLEDVSFWAILIFLGVISAIQIFIVRENEVLIFDTQSNAFYKLNKKTKEKSDLTSFSRISAIQIFYFVHTSTHSDSDGDTYETHTDAYELNLVLENKRVNIEANSNYKEIQKNARRISRLINVAIVEVGKL